MKALTCAAAVVALALTAGCGAPSEPAAVAPSAHGGKARPLDGGGPPAFTAFLRRHRGRPIVVNQWASWCRPCREEFPVFRAAAQQTKGRVVFAGVASKDTRPAAAAFLRREDPGFTQFLDPDARVARLFRGGRVWPATAFYRADGTLGTIHQGAYTSTSALIDDINRYAIDG